MNHWGLRTFLFVSLALLTSVPIAGLGLVESRRWQNAKTQQLDEQNTEAAHGVAQALGAFLASQVAAVEAVAAFVAAHPVLADVNTLGVLQAATVSHPSFQHLYIADADFVSLQSFPSTAHGHSGIGVSYADRDYAAALRATHRSAISQGQLGKLTRMPNVHIASPILDAHGNLRGAVAVSLDLRALQQAAQRMAERLPNARVVVTDSRGKAVVHPDPAAQATMKDLQSLALFAHTEALQVRVGPDDTGEVMRAAVSSIGGDLLEWTVVVYRPQALTDLEARQTWQGIMVVVALLQIVDLLLCALLATWLAQPIVRLARLGRDARAGTMELPPAARRREPREVAELLDAMQRMVERQNAHTHALESQVAQRTADLGATNKKLEQNLRELSATQNRLAASDRLASVGTLAAGIAHEVNNPLTFIVGNVQFATAELERRQADNPDPVLGECLQALKDANQGAIRVAAIVQDLRLFARADDTHVQPTDIRKVAVATCGLAMNEIRHRAQLVQDLQPVPLVSVTESQLGQVVLNLLTNAVHAIPLGVADRHTIRLSTCVHTDGRVALAVEDSGAGIDPANLHRIFDPFFTTKGVGEGMGLGLAISHQLVTSMGGEILVRSSPGKGACFTILLPPSEGAVATPAASAATAAHQVQRLRVLVVDDDPKVGAALKRSLRANHDVTVETDARVALELAAHPNPHDVILCDLMMPHITGMDFHAALLTRAPDMAARTVFMTGGAFTAAARAFVDSMGGRMVHKPLDLPELREALLRAARPAGPSAPRAEASLH